MSITAFSGPVVTFPETLLPGTPAGANPEAGPSCFAHGIAMLDTRYQFSYVPGQNFGKQTSGWNATRSEVINQVPATATVNNIATAQTATANTALTLVSGNTTGVTVSTSIVRADTGATVTGLLALDSAMTTVSFGSAGTIKLWDPTKAISRNIKVTPNGDDSSGTYTVRGYDVYGFPMSETITGGNATATSGAKAFKYVASVTPAGTVNSTGVTIGTGEVVGLPLRTESWGSVDVMFNNAKITATTGFTAAVTTTATATSGDVRGTYALQTASNGVLRLQAFITPTVANLATTAGLFGVVQFSN